MRSLLGRWVLALGVLACGSGCETGKQWDVGPFLQRPPRSILVLPPVDRSAEIAGSAVVLANITYPLVEHGYYVFPVAVVESMMRDNGLPMPDDMHAVSMEKLVEIFDPDAVLYLTVEEWGTSYQVISSTTQVAVSGELVDAETGSVLWAGRSNQTQGSSDGGGGLVGALVGALATQVIDSSTERANALAPAACNQLARGQRIGLLVGPYHENYEAIYSELRAEQAENN